MKNLERAIRVYMALHESDVVVSSSMLWDWGELRSALGHSPDLLQEMNNLDDRVRNRTLRYVEEFEPFSAEGKVYVFESAEDAEGFAEEMGSSGAYVERLSGSIVRISSSDDDLAEALAAEHNGAVWGAPKLSESFDYVDTQLPEEMLKAGLQAGEVEKALIEALWSQKESINEAVLYTERPIDKFRNRLSGFAHAKDVYGVDPFVFEGLRRSGLLDPRVCLLLEQEGAVRPGGVATAPGGGEVPDRGGVSKDQPDAQQGPPATSKEEPQEDQPKPTEHVRAREEGGEGIGQIKLPDGTIIPEATMRTALGKLLKNLATQVESGTEGGKPQMRGGPGAEQPEGPKPDAEDQPSGPQNNDTQPEESPAPTLKQQKGDVNPDLPSQPGFAESLDTRATLYEALGLIKTSDAGKIIRGMGQVMEIGFSGQSQRLVERVLDEMNHLAKHESPVIRAVVGKALSSDLYEGKATIVLREPVDYGTGTAQEGTPVSLVEDQGRYQLIELPSGDIIRVLSEAVGVVERRKDPKRQRAARKAARSKGSSGRKMAAKKAAKTRKKPMDSERRERAKKRRQRKMRGEGAEDGYTDRKHMNDKTLKKKERAVGGKAAMRETSRASMSESRRAVRRSVMEQLDVGQDDEKNSAAKALMKAADTLKSCRQHAFDLSTSTLVQAASMAEASGAKKTGKLISKIQEKVKGLMEMFGEAGKLLQQANETFKGESGGVGGDTMQQQQVAQAAAAPAVAPAAPTPVQAVESAIRKISRSGLAKRIAEGMDFREAIQEMSLEVAGLGLTRGQLHEAYDRISSVAYMADQDRDLELTLGKRDHRILSSVVSRGHLVEGLLARTAGERTAKVSTEEVQDVVRSLKKGGRAEHILLARKLENSMS